MNRLLMRCKLIPLTTLFALFLALVGCGQTTLPKESGTSTTVGLPESDPPVLTKAVADRMQPGLSQDESLSILQDAARGTPTAKSSVDAAVTQGKLNDIRYDLTITQGPRKLVLSFKDHKLVDVKQQGME